VEQCRREHPAFSGFLDQTLFHRFAIYFRAPRAVTIATYLTYSPTHQAATRHQTTFSQSAGNSRVAIPRPKPYVLRHSRPIIVTRSGDVFITKNIFRLRHLSFIIYRLAFSSPRDQLEP
jgi:hypothetical protein